MIQYEWCPGNGTRYHLVHAETERGTFIAWMKRGGSGGESAWLTGGPAMQFSGYLHPTYLMEKMDVNEADARGILSFLAYLETQKPDATPLDERAYQEARSPRWRPATLRNIGGQYP